MTPNLAESAAGIALLFFLPGFALTRALFPEWRLREGWIRIAETLTLSLVLSVSLTVLVGFVLGNLPGDWFRATWSDPLLEEVLGAFALVGFVWGWHRGAYSRVAPSPPEGIERTDEADPIELLRSFDRLLQEEKQLVRSLRRADDAERANRQASLDLVRRRITEMRERREAELAG
ncbi:MAG TPA: DUF1616 domain-containing protein [Thermoplasmata archaeon]|nr:DUF1616 domain-containing protein [Thermoplasmata archaeon]